MADTVQYLMEEMIPELEDLNKRGLFSKGELREVVKKRTNFEYNLKRRHRLRNDYLEYVQYEKALDRLRRLRAKRLADEDARTGSSDHSMSRRIHFIYERALRRFKNDLQLWVEYIEYCRHTRASKRIQKVIPRALQLHPTVPGLWSYAAAYEFDTNNNAKAARTLLQRGLRICPAAHVLWQDLFRLELMYVAKLRARREILGLSQSEGDKEGTEEGDEDDEADEDKKKTPKKKGILDGGLAILVARKGIEAVQESKNNPLLFTFVSKFFSLAWELDAPPPVEETLLQLLDESSLHDSPHAWDFRAQYSFRKGAHLRKQLAEEEDEVDGSKIPQQYHAGPAFEQAKQTYARAIKAIKTPHMYALAATFYTSLLHGNEEYQDLEQEVVLELEKLYSEATQDELMCEATWEGSVSFKRATGDLAAAIQQAREATSTMRSSVVLWMQRIGLHLEEWAYRQGTGNSTCSTDSAQTVAVEALSNLRWPESLPVWRQAVVTFAIGYGHESSQLVQMLLTKLLVPPGDANDREEHIAAGEEIACLLISEVLMKHGVEAMRDAYTRLLKTPTLLLKIVLHCAKLEYGCANDGNDGTTAAKDLLGRAIIDHGSTSAALWIQLIKLELVSSNISSIGNLHWRACKILKEPHATEFITAYNELMRK